MSASVWLATLDEAGFGAARYLLSALWQSSVLFAAAFGLTWWLRDRRPAVRQRIWLVALLAAPFLPLLTNGAKRAGAPQAPIAVLPAYEMPAATDRFAFRPEETGSSSADSGKGIPDGPNAIPNASTAANPKNATPPRSIQNPKSKIQNALHYPWALGLLTYCTGLAFFLGLIGAGRLQIRAWIRSARPVLDERVRSAFREAAKALGFGRDTLILESDRVPAPLSAGMTRRRVLLPIGLVARLAEDELRAVALHEISHHKRRDPLVLTLVAFVRAVFFFHPLVWVAGRQISSLAEQCADDAVIDHTGEPVSYAKLLARLAEDLPRRPLSPELAAGLLLGKGAFLRRVEAILSDRRDRIRRLTRFALAGSIAAVLLSIGLAATLPLTEKAPAKSDLAWRRTDKYVPPDFRGFFPDDAEGGKAMAEWWKSEDKGDLADAEILALVRRGFRQFPVYDRAKVLEWLGYRYVWGKIPQNADAIEIMYHATDVLGSLGTDEPSSISGAGIVSTALYYGLYRVEPKSPAILRTLIDLGMKSMRSLDWMRVTFIARCCESQKDDLLAFLQPYLDSKDARLREDAEAFSRMIRGDPKARDWFANRYRTEHFKEIYKKHPELKGVSFEQAKSQYERLIAELQRELAAQRAAYPVYAEFAALWRNYVVPWKIRGETARLRLAQRYADDPGGRERDRKKLEAAWDGEDFNTECAKLCAPLFKDIVPQLKSMKHIEDRATTALETLSFQVERYGDRDQPDAQDPNPFPDGSLENLLFDRFLEAVVMQHAQTVQALLLTLTPGQKETLEEANQLRELMAAFPEANDATLPPEFTNPYAETLRENSGQIAEYAIAEYKRRAAELRKEAIEYRTSSPLFAEFAAIWRDCVVPWAVKAEEANYDLRDRFRREMEAAKDVDAVKQAMKAEAEKIFAPVIGRLMARLEETDGFEEAARTLDPETRRLLEKTRALAQRTGDAEKTTPDYNNPYEEGTWKHALFELTLAEEMARYLSPLMDVLRGIPPSLSRKRETLDRLRGLAQNYRTGDPAEIPAEYEDPNMPLFMELKTAIEEVQARREGKEAESAESADEIDVPMVASDGMAAGPVFGPVTEIVVMPTEARPDLLIDLDTGKTQVPTPGWLDEEKGEAPWKWLEQEGFDIGVTVAGEDTCFVGSLPCYLHRGGEDWDKTTAAELASDRELEEAELVPGNITKSRRSLPATYVFKTREGGIGLFQIAEFTDDPRGVKVRFKRVTEAGSKAPALAEPEVEPAADNPMAGNKPVGARDEIRKGGMPRGYERPDLSEEPFQKKISAKFEETPLEDVIRILAREAGITVIMDPVFVSGRISIEIDDVSVGEVLATVLKARDLELVRNNEGVYRVAIGWGHGYQEELTVHIPVERVSPHELKAALDAEVGGNVSIHEAPGELIVTGFPLEIENVAQVIRSLDRATTPGAPEFAIAPVERKQDDPDRGRIFGQVVDAATGEPIAGAYVGVGDFGDSGGSNYSRHIEQGIHAKTKTDSNGDFELTGLVHTDEHEYLTAHPLVVTHPDFVRHDQAIELPSDGPVPDVTVRLERAAKIDVTLVDEDGEPSPHRGRVRVFRLEALDGHRFIAPDADPHLSSFASNVLTKQTPMLAFSFFSLKPGPYRIEALEYEFSPGGVGKMPRLAAVYYHGAIDRLDLASGDIRKVELKPSNYMTHVTLGLPEFRETLTMATPDNEEKWTGRLSTASPSPVLYVSRNPGLLVWADGKLRHVEDERLGRISRNHLFVAPGLPDDSVTLQGLPPGTYSVFAVGLYGQQAAQIIGAERKIDQGERKTVAMVWSKPTGIGMVKTHRLNRSIQLEGRAYRISELCDLLTSATDSQPGFEAAPSIRDVELNFESGPQQLWDILESLYLEKGWKIEEKDGPALLMKP